MNKIVSVAIVLTFVLMTLTACSDPLGLVAAEHERTIAQVQTEQIRADAATDQARISASTARVRVGGAMVGVGIGALALVAIVGIGALTHLQAQRDRLTHDAWRNQLPAQPSATALPPARPPAGHWMALRRPDSQQRPPTLALPERSETRNQDVIVIDG